MLREFNTVKVMIGLYCRDHHSHNTPGLCPSCQALADYAYQRLERCPFQPDKTVCSKCPVHCYKPQMRTQIKAVMRYAGPRMLYRRPDMALAHLLSGLRRPSKKIP
jgi:predicted amidophosphoribosyltransferase